MIYPLRSVMCITCVEYIPQPINSQRIPTGEYIPLFSPKKEVYNLWNFSFLSLVLVAQNF